MQTKPPPLAKGEVTEADFLTALREYDRHVAVIQKEMAERDKRWERRSKSSQAALQRIEKLIEELERRPC
ncbi:MAG: hypothetical protein EBS05_01510 [Proteobacteria bacterium]|nr:hypothetical protein [Pseudomonadota bacterium]NDD40405.1 hypothetical protein [Verrucomicrobiota bacterium]NDF00418.1 hypothetical protein [Verrucomicrobiota bacterium]